MTSNDIQEIILILKSIDHGMHLIFLGLLSVVISICTHGVTRK